MKRYESRYCTFLVPEDWVSDPPFAFREKEDGIDLLGVQVQERWLLQMPSATAYAQEQKKILAELYQDYENIQEGAHTTDESGGYFLVFRFLDEDGFRGRGKAIYLTQGPLVCQLLLTGPDGAFPERDRLFEAIGHTFNLRNTDFISVSSHEPLILEHIHASRSAAEKFWSGPWTKFPRFCMELRLPPEWKTIDATGALILSRGDTEIHLHRQLGDESDADTWLAGRIQQFQDSGYRLLGAERGEIDRGLYAAVLYDDRGKARSWKTVAATKSLDLFIEDEQPFVWTLRSPESTHSETRRLFEALVVSSRILDSDEWETELPEPWIRLTLRGRWEKQGLGVYADLSETPPILFQLYHQESQFALDRMGPKISESLSREAALTIEHSRKGVHGIWNRHDAFYFSLDGITSQDFPLSLRSCWVQCQGVLYGVIVRATAQSKADALLRKAVESLTITQ